MACDPAALPGETVVPVDAPEPPLSDPLPAVEDVEDVEDVESRCPRPRRTRWPRRR